MSDITRDYSFGGWVKHYRLQKRWTLREAATRLDMDAGNLSKLERGQLNPPKKANEVRRICDVLGVSAPMEDLFLVTAAYNFHLGILKKEFES